MDNKNQKYKKIHELAQEYEQLKRDMFGQFKFAVLDGHPDLARYEQLFQFFHSQFRGADYISPLNEEYGSHKVVYNSVWKNWQVMRGGLSVAEFKTPNLAVEYCKNN